MTTAEQLKRGAFPSMALCDGRDGVPMKPALATETIFCKKLSNDSHEQTGLRSIWSTLICRVTRSDL